MTYALDLTPLGPGDNARVRDWLLLPAVQQWWGSRPRAEAEITLADSSPSAICRIVRTGGSPIGYGHALDGALLDGGGRRGMAEGGVWECVLFIAAEPHRGRGLGRKALELLVGEVFATTLAVACVIRVPVSKEPAVRAVEAAGFRWQRVDADPVLDRVWVMRCDRPRR
jgi:RimJ/RimL family protein N-acetyltransferase